MTESSFVDRLPIGEQLPMPENSFLEWATFPFTGEMRIKPLEPPALPEPPRNGEDGPEGCEVCKKPLEEALWADEHWRVDAMPSLGVSGGAMLTPRGHYDLHELPAERAVEFGPMVQRVERAIHSLGGIARVHMYRWGDGGAHLHLWFLARPEGMLQFRGSFMSLWDELLPQLPPEQLNAVNQRIAEALAADGGTA